MKSKVKNTKALDNWDKKDLAFLIFAVVAILITSILGSVLSSSKEATYIVVFSTIGSVLSITSVVLAAKKHYSTFIVGSLGAFIYGILSIYWTTYWTAALQLLIVIPLSIKGYKDWKENSNNFEVQIKKQSFKSISYWILFSLILSIPIFFLFRMIPGYGYGVTTTQISDSLNFMFTITALVLSTRRESGTWILWIFVDIISIVMYISVAFTTGVPLPSALVILSTQVLYLLNALWGTYQWSKKKTYIGNRQIKGTTTGSKAIYK